MVAWLFAGWLAASSRLPGLRTVCRDWLAVHDRENWLHICLAGFLLGFPGLAVMLRHDANRRRRRGEATEDRPARTAGDG